MGCGRSRLCPGMKNTKVDENDHVADTADAAESPTTPTTPPGLDDDEPSESHLNFKDQYTLGKQLGEGATAIVRVGKKPNGHEYAVKCFDKNNLSDQDIADLYDEVDILRIMNHPNILKLQDFFSEPQAYYIVTDLLEGGELFDRIVEKVKHLRSSPPISIFNRKLTSYIHTIGILL